ncbi:hypothetical protein, conserved [Trypanosoma brucei gambiense DAL972]|uniref:Uncharacterized protein n=1 Tax=Trypanosoma brucei gambiense (strain MHOM/CI/86/DAL972) TaxID=679716 RepID=D0A6H0_TRYB9|nr:hypothetical protein, conserved [Trypanosoma brucei gambiense DAL972]CBH17271.1 hypothetical protein, conserved [Trypanosoma brucei gambiense DAL972]|eukprot:XP_011779535.1 hypothetical protein, conserved [Trypanosoma brucei gambiense DAL972]
MVYEFVLEHQPEAVGTAVLNVIPKVRQPPKKSDGDVQEYALARTQLPNQCADGGAQWTGVEPGPSITFLPQHIPNIHFQERQQQKQPSLRVGGVAVCADVGQEGLGSNANPVMHGNFGTKSPIGGPPKTTTLRKTRTNKPYTSLVPFSPEEEEQEGKYRRDFGHVRPSEQELMKGQQQCFLGLYQRQKEQRGSPNWNQQVQVLSSVKQAPQSDYKIQVGSNSCSNITALSSVPSECSPVPKPQVLQQQMSPPPYFGPQEDLHGWLPGDGMRSNHSGHIPSGSMQMKSRCRGGVNVVGNALNPQEYGRSMSTNSGPQPLVGVVPNQRQEQQQLQWCEWQGAPGPHAVVPSESVMPPQAINSAMPQHVPAYYPPPGDGGFSAFPQGNRTPQHSDPSCMSMSPTPACGPFLQDRWAHPRVVNEPQVQWQPAPMPYPLPPSYNSEGSRPSSLSVSVEPSAYNMEYHDNQRHIMHHPNSQWGGGCDGPRLTAATPGYPSRRGGHDVMQCPQFVPPRGPVAQWVMERTIGQDMHPS